MASRAILRQFGSWSNASLLETKPRLVMNFSWGAVSSGASDLHCTPLQRRGFQSDCYLVATSSIKMDSRTRWLVVAVLHSGIFTGSTVEVENEVDQKVASFEKSTIESLEEGRARGLYVLLVMTLLSVATSLLVGRMVAGPLRHLTDLMDKLSELDFEPENAVSRGARRSCIQDVAELEIAFGRLARGIGMFARFVPQTVVRNIVSQGDDFATRLKVDRRVVTVMCTDIAGFTSITELLVLRDLYFILTRYFSVMMSVVEIYQGVVSEILGDGLIVLWNAPDHVADHATAACAAALTQQQALCHVNDELKVLELTPLSIRIGIHTGSSLLGNIGSMTKMKYGCLGETKQLAIRLEEHCKYYEVDVICSSDTKNAIPPGKFFMRWLGKVKVRSDDEEMVGVHEVISSSLGQQPRTVHGADTNTSHLGGLAFQYSGFRRFVLNAGIHKGSCISVVGQDSYFKGGERNWELPEAIDHSWVLQTLRDERSDRLSNLIIFEGFKAYWDEEVVRELDLILWIRVKEETSKKRRMRNKSVTHEVWNDMWHHHGNYEKHWLKLLKKHVVCDYDAGCAAPKEEEKCVTLDGEQPAETVLKQALDVLLKRGILREDTDETDSNEPMRAGASRSRSRSRGRQPNASSPLDAHERCANPACWFRASQEAGGGGYCCRKCHWRHATGFKSGKAHNKECAKIEASWTAPLAAAVAPAEDYVSQQARMMDTTAGDVALSQQAIPTEDHTSVGTGVSVSVPVADSMTGISIHFQRKLCCANPNCPFLASSDPLQGGYCCSKCYWRALTPKSSKGAKRHNAGCARAYPETPGTARAPPDPPEEAKLYGPSPGGDESVGIAEAAASSVAAQATDSTS
ncbi:cya1 [Symbiodinium sp. CCMP2456]|nr:cya1 [Symbiodinium sp. CCMP2456]